MRVYKHSSVSPPTAFLARGLNAVYTAFMSHLSIIFVSDVLAAQIIWSSEDLMRNI